MGFTHEGVIKTFKNGLHVVFTGSKIPYNIVFLYMCNQDHTETFSQRLFHHVLQEPEVLLKMTSIFRFSWLYLYTFRTELHELCKMTKSF